MKTAVIFGVTGQDGYYLSKLLLEKDYKVVGVHRRSSVDNTQRLNPLKDNPNFFLWEGDVTDVGSIYGVLASALPVEIYNLAAQSHVATSFNQPQLTWNVTAGGCLNILEVIASNNIFANIRFYQASSSEMFGKSRDFDGLTGNYYQDEETAMLPQSPYAIAKLAAHHAVRLYRDSYNIFACSGILFNHESPLRGEQFVTRKITKWIGDYLHHKGNFPKLKLGNLNASRDWGHAEDYVRAMWMMLQHDTPDDYVVSMKETHTIKDFLDEAFKHVHMNWEDHVEIDPVLYRPCEVDYLLGDSAKIRTVLGWKPRHTFNSLVAQMVLADADV